MTAGAAAPPGSLDSLLGDEEPHATFHDARLQRIAIDFVAGSFAAELDVCVGDPAATLARDRERRRRGTLRVLGLSLWSLDPAAVGGGPLWLTDDGPLSETPDPLGRTLAARCGPGGVGWWLCFSNVHAFGHVAGESAEFRWDS